MAEFASMADKTGWTSPGELTVIGDTANAAVSGWVCRRIYVICAGTYDQGR